jgi:L-galactose dehydrogenase/L-glyceraldehyde 3-phosphate reductase
MQYRTLGRTGIRVSVLAFGAGPVSGLMTGADAEAQRAVVRRALDSGINWFDTAPGYGQGASEKNLGQALRALQPAGPVHVATKVRLAAEQLGNITEAVCRSVAESLARLGVSSVALLQLHNGVTARRGDEPTSITPADVLGRGGVVEAFAALRDEGLVRHLGLSGLGQPAALHEVVRSGAFDAIQVPYHLLNPSAGRPAPTGFAETDYGHIIADCAAQGMGVLAIRVFAAGALIGSEPSAHTLRTPFFPLALYERDRRRAARVAEAAGGATVLKEAALRFVLSHPSIHAAIVGLGAPEQVDEVVRFADAGPLPDDRLALLEAAALGGDVT